MTFMFSDEDVEQSMESVFIYDKLTRVGFPLTKDIVCIDISALSQEERLAVSANQIDDVAAKHGLTLISQLVLATQVLGFVLNELYANQPQHIQDQALASVKSALRKITKGDDELPG